MKKNPHAVSRLFGLDVGAVLLLAAILAIEPAQHQHRLTTRPEGARARLCALCVAGPARIASPAPALAVPVAITFVALRVQPVSPSIDIVGDTPSRAPPLV